jgi:hypothetical protein
MGGKPFTITRTEARELKRRDDRISRTGGVKHEQVVAEMRGDMARELRSMVRGYRHPSGNLQEVLECLAVAHAEGIDVSELCGKLLGKIAARKRARAA